MREISILKHLSQMDSCRFSTRLLDIVRRETLSPPDDFLFIVMELEDMDMYEFVKQSLPGDLTPEKVKLAIYQMLCALNFLSKSNIMHRDIKPKNILMNS